MDTTQGVKFYMSLPYTTGLVHVLHSGTWLAKVKELPGCITEGDSPEDAMNMLVDAMEGWLEVAIEDGQVIPLPEEKDDKGIAPSAPVVDIREPGKISLIESELMRMWSEHKGKSVAIFTTRVYVENYAYNEQESWVKMDEPVVTLIDTTGWFGDFDCRVIDALFADMKKYGKHFEKTGEAVVDVTWDNEGHIEILNVAYTE